jgi:hypothetical protein
MQQKDSKSMSEVRLGGPLAVCTVCTVCTLCAPVCTVCTGVHNGEIADGSGAPRLQPSLPVCIAYTYDFRAII